VVIGLDCTGFGITPNGRLKMDKRSFKGQPCPYKKGAICVEGDCRTCKIYEDRAKRIKEI